MAIILTKVSEINCNTEYVFISLLQFENVCSHLQLKVDILQDMKVREVMKVQGPIDIILIMKMIVLEKSFIPEGNQIVPGLIVQQMYLLNEYV